MNRRVFLLLTASLNILVPSCRESNQMPKCSGAECAKSNETTVIDPVQDSLRIDSLLDTLWRLECAVSEKTSDKNLVKKLQAKSFDSASGCYYVVGIGLKNLDLPEEAQPLAQKTSAKYAAEKWALFLKAVYSGEKTTFGTPVSGKVLYKKDLRTRSVDDSLFVLVMVPVGSVVVKLNP